MDIIGAKRYVMERMERELDPAYCYHNFAHTRQVLEDVVAFGVGSGVSEYELQLLQLAALFHDLGYLCGPVGHEKSSAALAAEALPQFGCTAAEVATVGRLIAATEVGRPLPTLLEQLIRDADLGNLGSDAFWNCCANFRRELANFGRVFADGEWYLYEIEFLGKFEYASPFARRQRGAKVMENRAGMVRLLEALDD